MSLRAAPGGGSVLFEDPSASLPLQLSALILVDYRLLGFAPLSSSPDHSVVPSVPSFPPCWRVLWSDVFLALTGAVLYCIDDPSSPGHPLASYSNYCFLALGASRFFAPEGTLPGDVEACDVIATGWETPEEKGVCFMF